MYEMSCQSRFDARYWMLGAGAMGRPRGMEWGGRREEGSGWGTHVHPWRIHVKYGKNHCSTVYNRTWKQTRCPSADEWIRKLWYIYRMEYYSAIKKNAFESVLMRWIKLEPIIQSEESQKEKHQYSILTHIYGI